MNQDQWFAWRKGDDLSDGTAVTASIIAQCASGSYGGMYRAVGVRLGLFGNDIDPYFAERGKQWEPALADMTTMATGLFVVGEQAWFQHPTIEWHRATIDGLLAPQQSAGLDEIIAGLELKTRSKANSSKDPWDYWQAQCQWSMHVTGLDTWVLSVGTIDDVNGQLTGFNVHNITSNPGYQQWLCEVADQYRWHVDNESLPVTADADIADVREATKQAHLDATDIVHISADLLDLYEIAKAVETRAKTLKYEAESILRQLIPSRGKTSDGRFIRISEPAMILTDKAKDQLVDDYPELGEVQFIGVRRAQELQPEAVAQARQPLGPRRITIKTIK